jgi:Mg-chelatase subunit ChlD
MLLLPSLLPAQSFNASQQKVLNNFMLFINESAEYVNPMLKCLESYYQDAERYRKSKNKDRDRLGYYEKYRCSKQLEEYYYKQAFEGSLLRELNVKASAVWQALERLDKQCKNLEIYIRLEDYKKDNLAQGDKLLAEFPNLFRQFRLIQIELTEAVYKKYLEANRNVPLENPYHHAEAEMVEVLRTEAELLKVWDYNMKAEVPTGFPTDLIEKNIAKNEELLRKVKKSSLAYPASSAHDGFWANLRAMQGVKRKAIDDYNFAAKQNDEHANYEYLNFINYYNGTLAATFNSYVDFAKQANQYLVYQPLFVNTFDFHTNAQNIAIGAKPFEELPYQNINLKPAAKSATQDITISLNNYINFINEAVNQNNWLTYPLLNFQQSANQFKSKVISYLSKYTHEKYQIPQSTYQKAIQEAKFLPIEIQTTLNTQLKTLKNALTEMDELGAELMTYCLKETYKTDELKRADEILDRYKIVYQRFDELKERLYADVRRVWENYPKSQPNSSWEKSSKALLENTDLTHDILFTAKKYFQGDSTSIPKPEQLNPLHEHNRQLIAQEYDNMKGIERIGRNHGLCPYNPYEDLIKSSTAFEQEAERVPSRKIRGSSPSERSEYHKTLYHYNDIIRYFNKFQELATVPTLKNILQPELFIRKTPKKIIKQERSTEEKKPIKPEEDKDFLKNMNGYAVNHLVFLLDVSGSMARQERLPLLKKSIKFLAGIMRPEDHISIVVYSGNAAVALDGVSSQDKAAIEKAIDNLRSSGNTNAEAGIEKAYQIAQKNFVAKGNNRIILATDGEFPLENKTFRLIDKNAENNISLSVFSFGNPTDHSEKLQKMVERGRGNYEHLTEENANLKLVKEAKAKKAE